jgi:hypothetical protein
MGARLQVEEAKEHSQDALEKAADSTWLERLARAGLAARGLLYLVVAVLAVQVARGHNDTRADKQGALHSVVRQPLGKVLVLVLAVGFGGYALWRFVEAAVGPSDERDSRKAALKRAGYAARGAMYLFFSLSAAKLLVSSSGGGAGSDTAEADWTKRILDWPAGPWLVGAVGLVVIAAGLYLGWRGLSRKFQRRLKAAEMSRAERRWILGFGTVGMLARMLVTVLIGIFLLAAAVQHDPSRAVGIDGALKRLADRHDGPAMLVLVAAGFAAYGLYSLAEARFRRVGSR